MCIIVSDCASVCLKLIMKYFIWSKLVTKICKSLKRWISLKFTTYYPLIFIILSKKNTESFKNGMVVELAYNDWANAIQKTSMLQEFLGPEYRMFKEPELRTVEEIITKYPEKKEMFQPPELPKKVRKQLLTATESNWGSCQTSQGRCRVEELAEELPPVNSLQEKGQTFN